MGCKCGEELDQLKFRVEMQDSRILSWDREQDKEWEALALVRNSDRRLLQLVLLIQLVCTLAVCGALITTWFRVERLESRVEALGGWTNE